jgi:hypothetical protein
MPHNTSAKGNADSKSTSRYYCRTRFIINLLPLLQQATSLRRVVTVFAGGKEGQIYPNDFQGWKVPMMYVFPLSTILILTPNLPQESPPLQPPAAQNPYISQLSQQRMGLTLLTPPLPTGMAAATTAHSSPSASKPSPRKPPP